jgi:hypothetical protein
MAIPPKVRKARANAGGAATASIWEDKRGKAR